MNSSNQKLGIDITAHKDLKYYFTNKSCVPIEYSMARKKSSQLVLSNRRYNPFRRSSLITINHRPIKHESREASINIEIQHNPLTSGDYKIKTKVKKRIKLHNFQCNSTKSQIPINISLSGVSKRTYIKICKSHSNHYPNRSVCSECPSPKELLTKNYSKCSLQYKKLSNSKDECASKHANEKVLVFPNLVGNDKMDQMLDTLYTRLGVSKKEDLKLWPILKMRDMMTVKLGTKMGQFILASDVII